MLSDVKNKKLASMVSFLVVLGAFLVTLNFLKDNFIENNLSAVYPGLDCELFSCDPADYYQACSPTDYQACSSSDYSDRVNFVPTMSFYGSGYSDSWYDLYISHEQKDGLVKVPTVYYGQWDGEYVWLYPDTVPKPEEDAIVVYMLNDSGQNYFWAKNLDRTGPPLSMDNSSSDYFMVPRFLPYGNIQRSRPPSYYGYPKVGLDIGTFLKWVWRVKSWNVNVSISESTYNDFGEPYTGSYSVNYNFVANRSPYYQVLLGSFDDNYGPFNAELDSTDVGIANITIGESNPENYTTPISLRSFGSSLFEKVYNRPTRQKTEEYYPNIDINLFLGAYEPYSGVLLYDVIKSSPAPIYNDTVPELNAPSKFVIDGYDFPIYGDEVYDTGSSEYSLAANITLTPDSYFTYGDIYDPDTGEEILQCDESGNEVASEKKGFLSKLFNGSKSIFSNQLAGVGHLNSFAGNIVKYIPFYKGGELAATQTTEESLSRVKFPKVRTTWFGGIEDVRTYVKNGTSYALDRAPYMNPNCSQKKWEFVEHVADQDYYYALDDNCNKIPYDEGGDRKFAFIGYNETGSVDQKKLREHEADWEFYAAFPLPSAMAKMGYKKTCQVPGTENSILKNYYLEITNQDGTRRVLTKIIDRGPKDTNKIDVSRAALRYLTLDPYEEQIVNARLVKKTTSADVQFETQLIPLPCYSGEFIGSDVDYCEPNPLP